MKRIQTAPRPDWQARVEKLGFGFHTMDTTYWDESAYYEFTMSEIETIERATKIGRASCRERVSLVV